MAESPREVSARSPDKTRRRWVALAEQLATPVLEAAAERRLHSSMPVETGPRGSTSERAEWTRLEAIGRLLCGLAPWLELEDAVGNEDERNIRRRLRTLAQEAVTSGVDASSPDRFVFAGRQPLVDGAFLALAIKRAPSALWWQLDTRTQDGLLELLYGLRRVRPHFNNWLLFGAAIEATLRYLGATDWDRMRVDYALHQFDTWYLGDGLYADGPTLKVDHYNSFVIHPFLLDICDVVAADANDWDRLAVKVLARAQRFVELQERMIAPNGTYPAWGRSLSYRSGTLHALGLVALRDQLPESASPAAIRCAMSAAIERHFTPGCFDEHGWLTIGFAGHQPALGEPYISTGSLYLCATGLTPLGLAPEAPFWAGPDEPWASVRLWGGHDLPHDVALEKRRPRQ